MNTDIESLIQKEGWQIVKEGRSSFVLAYGEKFPVVHPCAIHLKLYRKSENPERKYIHMKAAHDYLWPNTVWHYWTERRFRRHCAGWNYISYAGGASTTKSYDAAKIAIIFWLANPKGRGVIVASTSLESAEARIWGYIATLIDKMKVDYALHILESKPPKIVFDRKAAGEQGKLKKDKLHAIVAVSAKEGNDERSINNWIGRHPDEALLLILDEATDMPSALVKAFANLDANKKPYQCMAIGNSNSRFDLHGALSTPKDGWPSIHPLGVVYKDGEVAKIGEDTEWLTTQKNGICLFFSPYESPAIFEKDPVRKKQLSQFLIDQESIEAKEKQMGRESDEFWRFVIGFWRAASTDSIVISKEFLSEFDVIRMAEWSGLYPLRMVAGLDPAFSTGGDQCILRLALLGQTTDGRVVLDYRNETLMFKIPIIPGKDSAELQIAKRVLEKLAQFRCEVNHLVVDANGQGRALGEVIRLQGGAVAPPIKIYSTRSAGGTAKSFDVLIKTTFEMWSAFRDFIQYGQIKGLDQFALHQLSSRLVTYRDGKALLETKRDYKTRMSAILPALGRSPDEADAAALCLQSAILNFGFVPGQRIEIRRADNFADQKMQAFSDAKKVANQHTQRRPAMPTAKFSSSLENAFSRRRGRSF